MSRLGRGALVLLAIAVLGGGLRWAAMRTLTPHSWVGDEVYYVWVAANIANDNGHLYDGATSLYSFALRPPAYSWLLSRFIDTKAPELRSNLQDSVRPLLLFQLTLGIILILTTAALGHALFGPRVGLLAALGVAVYPTLIAHSHYFWSETLFSVLVTGALTGIVRGERNPSPFLAAGTGLVFGVAALTREIALPIAAASSLWWLARADLPDRRATLARAGLLLACATLVVLPWTIRNRSALDRWIPVATIGWFAAAEGNALDPDDWLHSDRRRMEFKNLYLRRGGEIERMDYARKQTLAAIRAEQPTWIFKKAIRNLALLLRPDSVLFQKLKAQSYRNVSLGVVRSLMTAAILSYVLVFVACVLGVALARERGRRLLLLLVFATVGAVHLVANSTVRFRMPWMPLAIVYASYAVLSARSARRSLTRTSLAASAAVWVFFFGVCVPHFRHEAQELWLHGVSPESAKAPTASGQRERTRAP